MSLRHYVVELITELGSGTVDDILPILSESGYTREQGVKALHNAQNLGYLWCEKVPRGGRKRAGARPSVYWPTQKKPDPRWAQLVPKAPEPKQPLVSCVWELGSPRTDWPESLTGRTYQPLGPWSGPEAA